uniref:YrhK domain-containing protein n=1 Tax=Alexandrium andersonii TaxID=327968 RepID=A0A7S2BPQ6_9DINO
MPGQVVKIRPVENVKVIAREHHTEMFFHFLGIFNEFALVVACIFFFEFMPIKIYITGIFMWIIGCLVGVVVSCYHMWEYMAARTRYKGEVRHEMVELVLYMFSHLTFVIGCVLFLPWFYKTQTELMVGHAMGTWCWIWGSVALVIAGHWNAIGFIEVATKLPQCRRTVLIRRFASVALTCTAVGAALFMAGSFLFRPGFKNQCESPEAFIRIKAAAEGRMNKSPFSYMVQPDLLADSFLGNLRHLRARPEPRSKAKSSTLSGRHSPLQKKQHSIEPDGDAIDNRMGEEVEGDPGDYKLNPFCVSIIEQGTLLYLIGCVAFLTHSILSTACSVLLHRIRLEDAQVAYADAYRRSSSKLKGDVEDLIAGKGPQSMSQPALATQVVD